MVTFETHDNGGRAFRVKISKQQNVSVSRITYDDEDNKVYTRLLDFVYLHKWIGVGVTEFSWGPQHTAEQKKVADLFSRGNACLFQTTENGYIFVGTSVISFQLPRAEEVLFFESIVGNNDVPYPWMATEKNVYFLCFPESTIPYVPLKHFIGSKDYYATFYGHDDRYPQNVRKQMTRHLRVKTLADRD